MKLVDWDKVTISYDKQVSGTITEPISNIKIEAPTVEAIPISIIKEELEYAHKMYDNSTKLTEPYWRGNVTALELLIIKWEKENGK